VRLAFVALPSHRCYLSKPKHKSINLNPDNLHPYAQLMWEDRSGGIVTPKPLCPGPPGSWFYGCRCADHGVLFFKVPGG